MSLELIKDFLAFVIMWMMYWLIFLHISDITIKKRYLFPLAFSLIIVNYCFQLETSPFIFGVFLAIYYYRNPKESFYKYIFYALFPVVTVDIFARSMALYLLSPLLDISPEVLSKEYALLYLSYGSVFPIYYFFNKTLNLNFKYIQKGSTAKKNFLSNMFSGLLLSYYGIFTYSVLARRLFPGSFNFWDYRQQIMLIYMFLYFWLLSEINHEAKLEMDRKLAAAKAEKIKALEDYNQHIEKLHGDMQSFKEYYEQSFNTLRTFINAGHLEAIQKAYGELIEGRKMKVDRSQYELGRLANLKVSPIKSILSTKMIEAQSQNVEAFLEIPDRIDGIYLDVLDMVIVLSVFLDNAIEAAKESPRPHISVAFFKREDSQLLVVENSISKDSVDIVKIFQKGYSTKGPNRGIGLANVRQILENYPETVLSTKMGHHSFTQILEMRPEP
ncbi:sensor histidine kinase [Streptococcus halotolerans]|uniref:sensor histidine kinase n=1 Tax=Streptococcus halotolerans TaxID=1814128 RepID=UPI000788D58B|nr:GHKL domain-containing protein [Streptococcus halotolerans]